MKYYRIKTGFDVDDFISIDETELEMALRAQRFEKVGVFKEGTVNGKYIISITPDFNRALGFHRDYKLRGEDYDELGRGVQEEHLIFLGEAKTKAIGSGIEKS